MERTQNSRVNPLTLTCDAGSWFTCSAHRVTERNILVKFNENRSKGSGDMERTRKCYGRNDRLMDRRDGHTDEGHSYNPLPLRGGGLIMDIHCLLNSTLELSGFKS